MHSHTRMKICGLFLFLALNFVCTESLAYNDVDETSGDQSSYRLSTSVKPISYKLVIQPFFDNNTFSGSVKIKVRATDSTNFIQLHHVNMEILTENVTDGDNEPISITSRSYNETTGKLLLSLERPLKQSENVTLSFTYLGFLRSDRVGFSQNFYFDENDDLRPFALTKFDPNHARKAFPCFDEPAMKATFKITIITPEGYHALSNMPVKKVTKKPGESMFEFEESVIMSTYLVAFQVSDFKSLEDGIFRSWARPEAVNQTEYALDFTKRVIKHLGEYFDFPYQLPKMDVVAVPRFVSNAMENWGLVDFLEQTILVDGGNTIQPESHHSICTIAHEMAHQWFGNLVTPSWWSHVWLSEGFGRYYHYIAADEIEPSWKRGDLFLVDQFQNAMQIDSYPGSKSMSAELSNPGIIGEKFGPISYSKGAAILRMIELIWTREFGDTAFRDSLRRYLKAMKYKAANPDDLWSQFQDELDNRNISFPVKEALDSWASQPGFPVITVNVNPTNVTLKQNRFLSRKEEAIPDNNTWWVPITWVTSNNDSDSAYWMKNESEIINKNLSTNKWNILNWKSAGFYRVNYDTESWDKIIKVLKSDDFEQIPEHNRAAIMDDLFALAEADLLDYNVTLNALTYLPRETNYLPIFNANSGLRGLSPWFESDDDKKVLKEFIISLIGDIYDRLGFDDKPEDDTLTILSRKLITSLACDWWYPDCIQDSFARFSEWKESGIPVPENQRARVSCLASERGRVSDLTFLWKEFFKSKSTVDRGRIISLGCINFESLTDASPKTAILTELYLEHRMVFDSYPARFKELSDFLSDSASKNISKSFIQKLEKLYPSQRRYYRPTRSVSSAAQPENIEPVFTWSDRHVKKIVKYMQELTKQEKRKYRLPDNVKPKSYNLFIEPFIIPDNFTFKGLVTVNCDVLHDTKEIVMHADGLNISQVEIFDKNTTGQKINLDSFKLVNKYQFLKISLSSLVPGSTNIDIMIEYTGVLNNQSIGLFRSSYQSGNETKWLIATQLEPIFARRMFPCFDEIGLKATFNISVARSNFQTVASNMEIKEISADGKIVHFKTTPPLSTYLVALLVSDFDSHQQDNLRVLASPELIGHADYALSLMKPIINFYEERFKVANFVSKLDFVAVPDFLSEAMENWGLFVYNEDTMLYDPADTDIESKQNIRNLIAHETSHEWFGDLVTPSWWSWTWLKEGFAAYFQFHAYTSDEVSWDLEGQFVERVIHDALLADSLNNTHPITNEVSIPDDIENMFDSISYGKASSIIRMIEKMFGSQIFYGALQDYLQKNKYSTTTPEVLFDSFDKVARENGKESSPSISEILSSWTSNEGYPILNVDVTENNVKLTQNRWKLIPSPEVDETNWIIPLTWITKDQTKTSDVIWMDAKEMNLTIDSLDWIIFNVDRIGFYRVNYTTEMWKKIIETLKSDEYEKIGKLSRAVLLDDLFNLAKAEFIGYELVYSATQYLEKERELVPWMTAINGFSNFIQNFRRNCRIYKFTKEHLTKLLRNNYDKLGFNDSPGDSHTDQLLRRLVVNWMCKLKYKDCIDKSLQAFADYRDKGISLPANQRQSICCTVARRGSPADWDHLWDQFRRSNYQNEQLDILSGLACTSNATLVQRLLNRTIDPDSGIRTLGGSNVFRSVADSGSWDALFGFLSGSYERITDHFDDSGATISEIFELLGSRVSTRDQSRKLKEFYSDHQYDLVSISDSLDRSARSVAREIERIERTEVKIGNRLDGW